MCVCLSVSLCVYVCVCGDAAFMAFSGFDDLVCQFFLSRCGSFVIGWACHKLNLDGAVYVYMPTFLIAMPTVTLFVSMRVLQKCQVEGELCASTLL